MLSLAQESVDGQPAARPTEDEEDDDGMKKPARASLAVEPPTREFIHVAQRWWTCQSCSCCVIIIKRSWKLFNFFSYKMLHWCICEILGAQRAKAKTKKKQWWRPWVDHASSRLTPQILYISLPPLSLAPFVLDQNAEDSRTASGLWRHHVVPLPAAFNPFLSLFKGSRCLNVS